jgi:hypothetical protein
MLMEEKEKLRRWVKGWDETGKFLEELRRKEIRDSNLAEIIPLFDEAFRSALWLRKAESTSGLVEFHKLMAKTR